MSSASQLIWNSAGNPKGSRGKLAEDIDGKCALCGHHDTQTIPLVVACPPASFGGWQQMRWPSSDRVCRACTWAMEGKPPNTLRMWSTLFVDGGVEPGNGPNLGPCVHACNRGAADKILEALCCPPSCQWAVGVAESGKVHVVPYMVLNAGDGPWAARVDRITLRGTPTEMAHTVHHFAVLVAAGFSARKILERVVTPADLVKYGIDVWRKHIKQLGGATAGVLERLAALLIRKEKANEWRERTSNNA